MGPTARSRPARLLMAMAFVALFAASTFAGAAVASAHNVSSGRNYIMTATDCWQMWVEIRHPSINGTSRQDMNVRNGRLAQSCSGSYRYSGAYTLRNYGELWSGQTLCGQFNLENGSGTYGFAVGFPSNCSNLQAIGHGRAKINGTWQSQVGIASVTHS